MSGALERVLSSQRMKRQHRRAEQVEGARRAVAYVRESTEEQGRGYSPDGQRQAIARYADEHGLELVEEYLDFETGREADKRAGFQRLIEDAIAHKFECVLIFHTSRFARNTIEAKRYKKLLRSELGIDVISVTQPLGTDVDDPAAFLSESVHEIFDEYYSVSLSFWTKMGLREKARQGLLTGGLAWGLLKGEDGIAVPDLEKAPYVLAMFEMYATGQHTDRTIAEWLNVQGQRTARERSFCADTVRDMLCNATYCGYVSGQRDRTKQIKGRHEAIVPETLFDRVQELRRQRARTLKPGRPSDRYVLRGPRTADAATQRCTAPALAETTSRATTAPRAARATAATSPSCPPRRSSASSCSSSPDSRPTQRFARRYCGASLATAARRAARRPSVAPRLRSGCAGCATSTNSATSSAASTSRAATRSTPS